MQLKPLFSPFGIVLELCSGGASVENTMPSFLDSLSELATARSSSAVTVPRCLRQGLKLETEVFLKKPPSPLWLAGSPQVYGRKLLRSRANCRTLAGCHWGIGFRVSLS